MDRQKESGRRERGREFSESNVPSATHGHLRKTEGSEEGSEGGGGEREREREDRQRDTKRVDEKSSGESSYFNVPSTARCRLRRQRERGGVVVGATLAMTRVYCEGHQPIHKGGGGKERESIEHAFTIERLRLLSYFNPSPTQQLSFFFQSLCSALHKNKCAVHSLHKSKCAVQSLHKSKFPRVRATHKACHHGFCMVVVVVVVGGGDVIYPPQKKQHFSCRRVAVNTVRTCDS